jgi:predicted HicB family RNase H-like nuclease
MKDMMEYKGYYGSVHYSDEDRIFHGKIEFIRSLVSYEGTDVKRLREAFVKRRIKSQKCPSKEVFMFEQDLICIEEPCYLQNLKGRI